MSGDGLDDYRELARAVAAALPVPAHSVYLIGSLACGGFMPGLSDVDLLAFVDGTRTTTLDVRLYRTTVSICLRPLAQLADPLAPLAWSGRAERRGYKDLTAVSDLMFLRDHGVLLRGAELAPRAVLPAPRRYLDYLRWESELAARSPHQPRRAAAPRRVAKRIALLIRDMLYVRDGRVSSRPADLLELVRPLLDDELRVAVMAALWLGRLPSRLDFASPLASHAIEWMMRSRTALAQACAGAALAVGDGMPRGWLQLGDLDVESFELCGPGAAFAEARPIAAPVTHGPAPGGPSPVPAPTGAELADALAHRLGLAATATAFPSIHQVARALGAAMAPGREPPERPPPRSPMSSPFVVVLRGPLAVGKSTLAHRLVEALGRCAYVEIDRLRRMVPDGDLSPRHLALAKRNACALARGFLAEGYSVILDSVFEHASYVELVRDELAATGAPLHVLTLEAPLAELTARDAGKPSPNFERVAEVSDRLAAIDMPYGARLATGGAAPEAVERAARELIASGAARVA